ncbi:hypothetical protein [Chryseobacterium sp.]|uniref:hypothetical protein n=1 Tax=Chryseobacterium sp. TaxID=1871047 RepID=UPI000EC68AEF|nr:hypothetical protein [Chryseobacterium sp.]HCM33384.1 hypothetical protein [Chryseobacterium sp.]
MGEFNIILHRVHIDTFFKNFDVSFENRTTDEEKISCFDFYLEIEGQRLNRYLKELNPDFHIDHRMYIDEMKNLIIKLKALKDDFKNSLNPLELSTYCWRIEEEKLMLLYEKLVDNFISSKTTFETFKFLFSGRLLNEAKEKIIWLKTSKNKHPNKKSITDFIDVLVEKYIISTPYPIQKFEKIQILNTLFSSKDKELKFTNSNFTTSGKTSEFRVDLEKIANTLL